MAEPRKLRKRFSHASKSSTSDSNNNTLQVMNLLGNMKGRCVTKKTTRSTGWLETMLSRLTTQKSDNKKASHPKEKRGKKSKVEDFRYSKLSLEDRQYLKSQLAIWFPCIVHRPTLSELETALAEMGSKILRGVKAFHVMDLDPSLTERKMQRKLFRSRQHSLKKRDVQLLMSTGSKKMVDHVAYNGECDKLERKLTNLSLLSAKFNTLGAKQSSNSFIYGENNWRHSLMSYNLETSVTSAPEQPPATNAVDHDRLLLLYDTHTYNIPRWFHCLVEKGAAINLEIIHHEQVHCPVAEARELMERPRRISLHLIPPGISLMVKGHLFVSIMEQERMKPVANKCVNMSTNNMTSSSPAEMYAAARKLPFPRKSTDKNLNLYWPENDLEIMPTNKTYVNLESRDGYNDGYSSQDDFFPKERAISFEHTWAYVQPKNGRKSKKSKLKRIMNIKNPWRFNLKIPYDSESSGLINTKCQNYPIFQTDASVNKQTNSESVQDAFRQEDKSNAEIRYVLKAQSIKFSHKLRKMLRKKLKNLNHSVDATTECNEAESRKNWEDLNLIQKAKSNLRCRMKQENLSFSLKQNSRKSFSESPSNFSYKKFTHSDKHDFPFEHMELKDKSIIHKNIICDLCSNTDNKFSDYADKVTLSPRCKNTKIRPSKQKRKPHNRMVQFSDNDKIKPMDKSNSSLSDPFAIYTPGFLFDDIASSHSIECLGVNDRSSDADIETVQLRAEQKFHRPNATFVKKTSSNNVKRKTSQHSDDNEHYLLYIKDCSNDTPPLHSDSRKRLSSRKNQTTRLKFNSDNNSMQHKHNKGGSVGPMSSVLSVKLKTRKDVVMNETYRSGSLSDFVKEQWRSGYSSSSRDNDHCSFVSEYQSSCAESRSVLLKRSDQQTNIRQAGPEIKPRGVSKKLILEQNGHNVSSSTPQADNIVSRHYSRIAGQDEQALFKKDEASSIQYQSYREVVIPDKNSATLREQATRLRKTTVSDKTTADSEYNDNNEHVLTSEASTSTSSELKMSTPTTTTKEVSTTLSSPEDKIKDKRQVKNTWLTLKDLGSLLSYCSKILSANEPLAEGTVKILKAVNETLSWYFLEEETCSPSLNKGRSKTSRDLHFGSGKQFQEEAEPDYKLKFKHRDSHELNTIKCKAISEKVRLSKMTNCRDYRSQLTRRAPLSREQDVSSAFSESPVAVNIHLDETQNKLDSENDQQVDESHVVRSTTGMDSKEQKNRKRSSFEDLELWHLADKINNEDRSPKSHEFKQEALPAKRVNIADSITTNAMRYNHWSDQVYKAPLSNLSTPLDEPGSAQKPKNEIMAPKREYFEQKDVGRNSNDIKNFEGRCNLQMPLESDLPCCPPREHFPPWYQSPPLHPCPTQGGNYRTTDCHCFTSKTPVTCKARVTAPPFTHDNTTSSCLAEHCICNLPYSIPPKHYSLSRCLDCLDRVDCCSRRSRKRSRKPFYDSSFGCLRADFSGLPGRLESPQPSRVPTSTFDFPRSRCNFSTPSSVRPCWQTVGDMTSEFERKFNLPVDRTFQRKIPISDNLNLFTGDLEETMVPAVSPVVCRYPNLVPNLSKKRSIIKSDADQRATCEKESVQRETLEYITELLKTCLSRHTDSITARCSGSETKVRTCKLSDDDRQLMESLKSKLDSKLLQRLMQTEVDSDRPQATHLTRKSVTCDDKVDKSFDCMCCPKKCDKPDKNPETFDNKKREAALHCLCCSTDVKNQCETKARRMYCKGLQADMSWAAARCRETSVQTCDCFETRHKRCFCGLGEKSDLRPAKLAYESKCMAPDDDGHCLSDNDQLRTTSCLATSKKRHREFERLARCTLVEDVSSCTHLESTAVGKKRNKSIQTSITCPLEPSFNRCTLCKPSPCFRPDNSLCRSASDIYPNLFPDRMEKLTWKYCDTACGQLRNKYWLNEPNMMNDAGEETRGDSFKTREKKSFYVKKWDSPSECSTLLSDFKDRFKKPIRNDRSPPNYSSLKPSYKCRRQKHMFPDSPGKSKLHVKSSNWLDVDSSKTEHVSKESAPGEPCHSQSPEVNRPIVHIRYKSRKVNGKSEITVDSVPQSEERVTSPVRNLALQLKKHVEQIIENSKELKQQALNNKRCSKRNDGAIQQSDATSSCKDNMQGVVKFHTSRKDDGAWSYEVKIKSPVCQQQDKMSESYVSQNVNCGNNSGQCETLHSDYGVTVDVTMPETCVDDDTDRLIQDVLPGILKIILCVILKVKGCVNQDACNEQTSSGQHQQQPQKQHGASENFNSNAYTDKTDDDDFSNCRHFTSSKHKHMKIDSSLESKTNYRKTCLNHRIEELKGDDRFHNVSNMTSPNCHFNYSDLCSRGLNRHVDTKHRFRCLNCHVHTEPRPSCECFSGYFLKHHSGRLSHTSHQREQDVYCGNHRKRQTQTSHTENGCGEMYENESGKTVSQSKSNKTDNGSHKSFSCNCHTTIIEDFSSLTPSDDMNSVRFQQGERKDLSHRCIGTQVNTFPCKNFKQEMKVTRKLNGCRKMTRIIEDISSRQTTDDTWGLHEKFLGPGVVMECSDSTPIVHATHSNCHRLNTETNALTCSRERNMSKLNTRGAKQLQSMPAVTKKRKSKQSLLHDKLPYCRLIVTHNPLCKHSNFLHCKCDNCELPTSQQSCFRYCKGHNSALTSSQQSNSLPCTGRNSVYISTDEDLSVPADSAASSHGIDDIPLDSGAGQSRASFHRVSDRSTLQGAASRGEKKRHSGCDAAPKNETPNRNITEGSIQQIPDRQTSVVSAKINTVNIAEMIEVNDNVDSIVDTRENDKSTVYDAMIRWWNTPNITIYHETVKSAEHPPPLPVKSAEHPPPLPVKTAEHPPPLPVKTAEHPPPLPVKSVEHPPPLPVKSVEHPPPLPVKSVEHPAPLLFKSVDPDESRVRSDGFCKKYPVGGWMTGSESFTSLVHPTACDKSTYVRDTKIRQPWKATNDKSLKAYDITKESTCLQVGHTVAIASGEIPKGDDTGSFNSEDGQSWQNTFVSSAELTEATSERVVLEGTFFKSNLPGDNRLGHREQGSSFLPQNSTCLLPFRLVLFAADDGMEGKVISGTYLRRMVSTDRFFKWNVKFDLPVCEQ